MKVKKYKIFITLFVLFLVIFWFFYAYSSNPRRDNPTFKNFTYFRYLEHFCAAFGGSLGLATIIYVTLIIIRIMGARINDKAESVVIKAIPILIVFLFEAWYQLIFKYNSDSLPQIVATVGGEFAFLSYVKWTYSF